MTDKDQEWQKSSEKWYDDKHNISSLLFVFASTFFFLSRESNKSMGFIKRFNIRLEEFHKEKKKTNVKRIGFNVWYDINIFCDSPSKSDEDTSFFYNTKMSEQKLIRIFLTIEWKIATEKKWNWIEQFAMYKMDGKVINCNCDENNVNEKKWKKNREWYKFIKKN